MKIEIEHIEATPRSEVRAADGTLAGVDYTVSMTVVVTGAAGYGSTIREIEQRLTQAR